ncbi:MAG: hypothetical protein MI975_17675 [Cytophagales bacterium]|nr:hypothetical protein [Cytophagales bacterium]
MKKKLYAMATTVVLLTLLGSRTFARESPLFQSDDPIELILEADLLAIIEDKSDEPEYKQALLIQKLSAHEIHAFEIKVKPRGNTRRVTELCDFPPLKFNFKKKQLTNTIFEGQDKLKFVSKCRNEDEFQNYVFEEYLLYKTYSLITEESYRTRLVNITIKDSKLRIPALKMSGFLIEDDKSLAKRLGVKELKKIAYSRDSCTDSSVDRLAMFQFMIGNTDWYINTRHNIDVFQSNKNNELFPVPYDFDYSGVINTRYAIPSRAVPITNVKQRYFKGSCRNIDEYGATIELFNNKKEEIFALYNSFNYLPRGVIKKSLRYFTRFYKIINNQDLVNESFYNVCNTTFPKLSARNK